MYQKRRKCLNLKGLKDTLNELFLNFLTSILHARAYYAEMILLKTCNRNRSEQLKEVDLIILFLQTFFKESLVTQEPQKMPCALRCNKEEILLVL